MKVSLDSKRELIQDLESLFQFVIMITLFFLTFTDIFFRYVGSTPEQVGFTELKWVNMPIALVVSYVFFRIFRKKLREGVLKTINIFLLIEIVSIAIAITVVLIDGNQLHSYFAFYSLKSSLWTAMSLSTLILIFSAISALFLREKT